jgi:predicted dehydrogenase
VSDRILKIGMIGAGFMGQLAHLMNLVEIRNCRVVAVAELRPELRRQVAERHGIPRTYETHHDLLKDPEVEAVVVVTPRQHLGPVVLDCLNAGKHVLSEKPMAGTLEQGKRLVDAAHAQKVNYAVGYMKRYDEGVQTAKRLLDELISSQELGPVIFARVHCFMGDSYCNPYGHVVTDEKPVQPGTGWPIAPDWVPENRAQDFAAYMNTYSHNINMLRHLLGRTPTAEYAHFSRPAGRLAVLSFGTFVASLETGRSSNRGWDEVTEIHFADGRLTIRTPPALLRNVPATVELYKAGTIQQVSSPQSNWTWAFRRQAEAFVTDSLAGLPSLNAGTDALEDLRLGEEMWRLDLARSRDRPKT